MAVRWGRAVFQVQQRPGTEGVGHASGTGAVRWDTPTGGSSLRLPRLAGWGWAPGRATRPRRARADYVAGPPPGCARSVEEGGGHAVYQAAGGAERARLEQLRGARSASYSVNGGETSGRNSESAVPSNAAHDRNRGRDADPRFLDAPPSQRDGRRSRLRRRGPKPGARDRPRIDLTAVTPANSLEPLSPGYTVCVSGSQGMLLAALAGSGCWRSHPACGKFVPLPPNWSRRAGARDFPLCGNAERIGDTGCRWSCQAGTSCDLVLSAPEVVARGASTPRS